jgi:predicted RNA binding protein YcfA (HicA-like mRNA interferase family)
MRKVELEEVNAVRALAYLLSDWRIGRRSTHVEYKKRNEGRRRVVCGKEKKEICRSGDISSEVDLDS